MQPGSKKVLRSLFEQKIDGTLCDVQLHLQGTVVWGHACVLASCSPYFMDYFKQGLGEDNHWCTRIPLVISLDKFVNDGKEVCLICVSKIVDFMYLRELIVLKGHFQHFCKIVRFLKVTDLLPLCKTYFEDKSSNDFKISDSVNEKLMKQCTNVEVGLDNGLRKPNTKLKRTKENTSLSVTNESNNKLVETNSLGDKNNQEKTHISTTQTTNCLELKNVIIKRNVIPVSTVDKNTPNAVQQVPFQHEPEDKQVEPSPTKCEFMCCNPDLKLLVPSGCEAKRRKRKMICEVCQFKSISINKIIKHVQTTSHYGIVCPVCNLKEEHFGNLEQHIKDHDNAKPFKCNICQKRNRFWEYHKLHLRVHCRNKQFCCKICQRTFQHNKNLANHMMSHSYKHACNTCGHLSSDVNEFQSHQLQHRNEILTPSCGKQQKTKQNDISINHEQKKFEIIKKFQCYLCCERFTQQKNLARHIQLKHFCVSEYKCTKCTYLTKRYDGLKDHMKRHHHCLPPEEKSSRKRKGNTKKDKEEKITHKNGTVGVLIPVEILSTDSTSETFTVKACSKKISVENVQLVNTDNETSPNNNIKHNTSLHPTQNVLNTSQNAEVGMMQPYVSHIRGNFTAEKLDQEPSCSNLVNNLQISMDDPTFTKSADSSEPTNHLCSEKLQKLHFNMREEDWNCSTREIESHFLEKTEHIWLNEATGELLSGSNFINIPMINTDCTVDKHHSLDASKDKSSLDFEEPFQSIIINNNSVDLSVLDLDDDDLQSNPKTPQPQPNLVDFESQDNLFSLSSLSDNFCSTWVLNETTGELNLVSFGMQPLQNYDELKLDEITGTLSSIDDDETALFLNEGTGDLSVIYFNPSKNYCDSSNYFLNDQLNQEKLETLSQHSNDEDDLLNEEFLLASATFMARDENETFLNELTGEFDVASYNFHQETHQIVQNDSVYLNEETGEISWNVVDQNMNNEILTNSDSLAFDVDDSLNCEDFEQFSTGISDFSTQFRLGNEHSNDWHHFDEASDTMLNECTGELVKRM